jgi:hypothetical protein
MANLQAIGTNPAVTADVVFVSEPYRGHCASARPPAGAVFETMLANGLASVIGRGEASPLPPEA